MRASIPAMLCIALASCGARHDLAGPGQGGSTVETAALTKLALSSGAFRRASRFRRNSPAMAPTGRRRCTGPTRRRRLAASRWWSTTPMPRAAPSATGASTTFHRARGRSRRSAQRKPGDQRHGQSGYGGPCPPKGHGPHHYHFKLFALDIDKLGVEAGPKVAEVEKAARNHAIAQGELIGTYERK